MKRVFIFCLALQCGLLSATDHSDFEMQQDVAQYKGSDYANVVQVARNISLEKAFDIAKSNPDIAYFVYTKGYQMVLEIPPQVSFNPLQDPFGLVYNTGFFYDSGRPARGYCRIFQHGDVVFFKKEGMQLSSAPGLADAYIKKESL